MTVDKHSEFIALINLIDEPDEEMYRLITQRIIEHGSSIMPYLKEALENSFRREVEERLNKLISTINLSYIRDELMLWQKMGAGNLLHGLFFIAKYRHTNLEIDELKRGIAEIQHDIWIEMNKRLTLLEKIKVFNHVFYDIHGFKPNRTDFHNPSNSYINEVLNEKTGNPILLSCLYMILARNLGIPVYGANVPEHFLCVVVNEGEDDSLSFIPAGEPLFYINPFSLGALFTRIELSNYLSQRGFEEKPEYFVPCTNQEIIFRVLNNLSHSYNKLNDTQRYQEIEELKKHLL
jgi:regulator of sirC expression with transglutaminase-like and TPR domain